MEIMSGIKVFVLIMFLKIFAESIVDGQDQWHRKIEFESSSWGGQFIAKKTTTFPECVTMCYRGNYTAFGYQPTSKDCRAFYELTYGSTDYQFNRDTMVFLNKKEYVIRSQVAQLSMWINESSTQTWNTASATCAAKNGRLLVLDSAIKEQQFIDMIRAVNNFKSLWLGLNYSETQGQYLWASGSAVQWGSGKFKFDLKDGAWKTKAYCAYIIIDSLGIYDQDCSRMKAFVCEKW